jgi:alkanesulfonate monooxygenase SsuD/methylene tetrahydromethanopterin reductase-like flavin-dependent oxidoreductase (luciferase family)
MSKQGRWNEMAEAIDDELLDAFAVIGEPEPAAHQLLQRYGDVATRFSFYAPYESDSTRFTRVLDELRQKTAV